MDKRDGNIYEIGSRVIILSSEPTTSPATIISLRIIFTASLRQQANEEQEYEECLSCQ